MDVSNDGVSGLDNALSGSYDLLVLDVMLPGLDGFALLQRLRSTGSRLPVLMLTARGELSDRVRGLDQGADYYLTKPFQTPELLACVRLLLRRSNGESGGDDRIHRGDLVLDPGTFQVTCGQRGARLSRKEYDLLEMLMRNGGQILSKSSCCSRPGAMSPMPRTTMWRYTSLSCGGSWSWYALTCASAQCAWWAIAWRKRNDPKITAEDRGHQFGDGGGGAAERPGGSGPIHPQPDGA